MLKYLNLFFMNILLFLWLPLQLFQFLSTLQYSFLGQMLGGKKFEFFKMDFFQVPRTEDYCIPIDITTLTVLKLLSLLDIVVFRIPLQS